MLVICTSVIMLVRYINFGFGSRKSLLFLSIHCLEATVNGFVIFLMIIFIIFFFLFDLSP